MDQQDIQNKVAELPNEQVVVEEKEQTQQENEVNPEPQEENDDEGEGDSDGENGGHRKRPQWDLLTELISDRALEAVKASRDVNATRTPAEHHAYFRTVYERMREEAAARDDIPNALTDPPLQELRLEFAPHSYSGRCPCCFDFENFPSVMVYANPDEPDGVTKDQVIEAICAELHPFPKSEEEQSPKASEDQKSPAEPSGEKQEETSPLPSDGDESEEEDTSVGYDGPADFSPWLSNFAWMRDGGTLLDGALFVFYMHADTLDEDFYLNFGEPAKDDDDKGEVKQDKEEDE